MARQITFSVIIPTYNREVYLLDAVLSAVNASPENTEIIIVNDGRQLSEATRNRLGALNAVVLKTAGGTGAGAARNLGAERATGQWLLFLDDDDLVSVEYWQSIFELLVQGDGMHYRSYGFCQTTISKDRDTMYAIANTVKSVTTSFVEEKKSLRMKMAALCRGFWLSNSIFKEVGGFDPELRVNEDTDLCLKLVASGARCYISSFDGVIVYKGPRNSKVSKSVTKEYNASERASYFKKIIGRHSKLLEADRSANKWVWKRYLKMAARARKKSALVELAENTNLDFITKFILRSYWYIIFLSRL